MRMVDQLKFIFTVLWVWRDMFIYATGGFERRVRDIITARWMNLTVTMYVFRSRYFVEYHLCRMGSRFFSCMRNNTLKWFHSKNITYISSECTQYTSFSLKCVYISNQNMHYLGPAVPAGKSKICEKYNDGKCDKY